MRWATSQELPPHRYRPAHGHRVARRLLQVLALMAEGRTNTAIGQALVVTQGAVEKHISSIFSKLGLPPSDNDHRRVVAVLTGWAPAPEQRCPWSAMRRRPETSRTARPSASQNHQAE